MKLWGFGQVIALASACLLVGCSQPSAPANDTNSTNTTTNASVNAEPKSDLKIGIVFDKGGIGDKSFNDSAWRGLEKAQKEFGVEVAKVDSKDDAAYEPNITSMAERDCDLVIAVGFGMLAAVKNVAPKFPDTKFALIDAVAEGDNVRNLLFSEHEGSFLVGYLAAMTSKTKKVGFVGGMDVELIHKFYYGYKAGVDYANNGCLVLEPKYTQDWNNQDTAKASANVLFAGGADIIYHAAGRAGLGVISAAKDKKLWAIGVDSDQDDEAPGSVLTSMIKRVDEAVYMTISDMVKGSWKSGTMIYDLKAGGVGTSDFRNSKTVVTPELEAKVKAAADAIIKGDIKVPMKKEEYEAAKVKPAA